MLTRDARLVPGGLAREPMLTPGGLMDIEGLELDDTGGLNLSTP